MGSRRRASSLAIALLASAAGCTSFATQLPATDFELLEGLHEREAREEAYERYRIRQHREANGLRFTVGDNPNASKRDWQSLDRILRSDKNAAAALPEKKRRLVRVFTALTGASLVAATAGVAGTAREGFDTNNLGGSAALLLAGGVAAVGFAVTAGVLYGRMRGDYIRAVEVYNDSLGLRLGLFDADGRYLPPAGSVIDEEGFVLLSGEDAGATPPAATEPEAPSRPEATTPAPVVPPAGSEAPESAAPSPTQPPGPTQPPTQRPAQSPDEASPPGPSGPERSPDEAPRSSGPGGAVDGSGAEVSTAGSASVASGVGLVLSSR